MSAFIQKRTGGRTLPVIQNHFAVSKWGHHWDLSLDYPLVLEAIKSSVERLRALKADKELVYNEIILCQLLNEARVSEAQEALMSWAANPANTREVRVRTRKRYDREERLVIIPDSIKEEDRPVIAKLQGDFTRLLLRNGKEALDCGAVRKYAKRAYGINTHSLRFSGITELGVNQEISPLVIAKITKHKNLNQLLTYIQEKEGVRELRRQVSGLQ